MALSKESFLPDEVDCAETWRQLRWTEGPECPECGSIEIQTRQKNRRGCFHYCCRSCGRWFTGTTDTFLEASNVSLSRWVYLIREMDKKRLINDIAKDLGHSERYVREEGAHCNTAESGWLVFKPR